MDNLIMLDLFRPKLSLCLYGAGPGISGLPPRLHRQG